MSRLSSCCRELRWHILSLLADGHSWSLITAVLFCSSRTVARWQHRFQVTQCSSGWSNFSERWSDNPAVPVARPSQESKCCFQTYPAREEMRNSSWKGPKEGRDQCSTMRRRARE